MALLTKNKPNQFGFKTDYWRIAKINIDLEKMCCDIRLHGYISKEAAELKFEPVETKLVRANWDESQFPQYLSPKALDTSGKNLYQMCYEYVKTKEDIFKHSEDC